MLVGFVGAACSGKSTTASRLFAELKELGTPVEYITEQARIVIARKRYEQLSEKVYLTDLDQLQIVIKQDHLERIMMGSCGPDVAIITDTSILNTLLYMSEDYKKRDNVEKIMKTGIDKYDILFLCGLVPRLITSVDPNRLHTEDESRILHDKLEPLIEKFAPNKKIIHLEGPPHVRLATAISEVLDKLTKCGS